MVLLIVSSMKVVNNGLEAKVYDGFLVMLADGYKMSCTRKIPQLSIALDNYSFIYDIMLLVLVEGRMWYFEYNGWNLLGGRPSTSGNTKKSQMHSMMTYNAQPSPYKDL